jgi:hypothetical protein
MRLELKGIEDLTISLCAMLVNTNGTLPFHSIVSLCCPHCRPLVLKVPILVNYLKYSSNLTTCTFSALMDLLARESYRGSRVSVLLYETRVERDRRFDYKFVGYA